MNTTYKNGFVLLSTSDEWYKQISPEELQKVINDNKAWVDRLVARGMVKGGQSLAREGAIVFGNNKQKVFSDGPFAESKEAIGGTLMLDVATMEEAIAIAKACPSLRYNTNLEVRPINDECPLNAHARQKELVAANA